MHTRRIYADNAATSFPKPPCVMDAVNAYASQLGASAGRGAYREAMETGELLAEGRRRIARMINGESSDTIVYAFNCSGALNMAIHGLLHRGSHVVASRMEHNSVLRPLHALMQSHDIRVTWIDADPTTGVVDLDAFINALTPDTKLACLNHASNVTGTLQDIARVGAACRKQGIPLLVDAAQTVGHVPIDVQALNVDLLAFPGHKAMLAPLGTGALYIRPGLEDKIAPHIQGGTGSVSDEPVQPSFLPDKFEPGSHNALGIAGWVAALKWLEDKTIDAVRAHDLELSHAFINQTADIDGLRIFGPTDPVARVSVFSVAIDGLEPSELAALLETEFGILTRPGIHCAPFVHETLGTTAAGGTVRLSFGVFNTLDDIAHCTQALAELAGAKVGG